MLPYLIGGTLTWRNFRSRKDGVSERLEWFLVREVVMYKVTKLKTWMGSREVCDHVLVFLQIEKDDRKLLGPFNFDSSRLKDEEFLKLVIKNNEDMIQVLKDQQCSNSAPICKG